MEAAEGKAAQAWGKKTKDELAEVSGRFIELVGNLQEHYGIARAKAAHQIACFNMHCKACHSSSAAQLKRVKQKMIKLEKALSEGKKARKKILRSTLAQRVKKRSQRIGSFGINGGKIV